MTGQAVLGSVPGQGQAQGQPGAHGGERGSGTVLMLAVVAVALILALGLGALARAELAHGQARTAADLAALAGAGRAVRGDTGGACGLADQVARANAAAMDSCALLGQSVVQVEVSIEVPGIGRAQARARAGPRTAGPGNHG